MNLPLKLRRSRIADAAVALKIEPHSFGARFYAKPIFMRSGCSKSLDSGLFCGILLRIIMRTEEKPITCQSHETDQCEVLEV